MYYRHAVDEDTSENQVESEVVTSSVHQIEKVEEKEVQRPVTEDFKEKHIVIEEEQIGVTYDKLFGPIFKGAKHIAIIDPYIRNFYQTLNLMELLEVVEKCKSEADVRNRFLNDLNEMYRELDKEEAKKS